MGADYYTYLHLGLEVTKDDFVKQVTETQVVCDHPEAEGTKFCPVCGTAASKRTKQVTKEVWVSDAIAATMKAADIEDWGDALYDPYEGTEIATGLRLYKVTSSSMDDDGKLILGHKLGKIGGWTNEWLTTLDPDTLTARQANIEVAAKKMGLNGSIRLFISHYCSV